MDPRDTVKLAFQYQETERVPYDFGVNKDQAEALTAYYGNQDWRRGIVDYLGHLRGVDNFLSPAGTNPWADGSYRDCLGCAWVMGSTHHLVDWPLKDPKLGNYRLPDLQPYFDRHVRPKWPEQIEATEDRFRIVSHSFGLFERAWSLRGFEDFLMDLVDQPAFVEELLDHITEWFLQSTDLMATAPVDAIMFTDDHAAQRGLLMGNERWRAFFKPRWKKVFERVHRYGLYTIMHMCGDTSAVVPDLIEIGLDCMESCQPECMDIYALKREYGRHIRFWGGLGAQSVLPFGSADDVRREVRKLKREMGRGGGYILAGAKGLGSEVPVANIAACLEEAQAPRTA